MRVRSWGAGIAACAWAMTVGASYHPATAVSPLQAENALPGDLTWRSGRQADAHQVEVRTSVDSAEAGQAIAVRVSTDVPAKVKAQVFRLGYYRGAGARQRWSGGPYKTDAPAREDTFSFTIGNDWAAGVYVIKVVRADGLRSFTHFLVRSSPETPPASG